MSGPPPLTTAAEERFWHGVEAAGRFFLGEADVQKALVRLGRTLDSDGIAYAVIDAMALNEFGYRRMTVDLNVLLLELKLASGMTAAHRLRDLADVQEVIRVLRLPHTMASELDAFVRDKYLELWQTVQDIPEE